jgi:enoyl-CoA hydratase/carnithine racemase
MGFPECSVGVTITNGGTFFAPRVLGLNKAREMAYTGEFITAEEGYRIGAVSRVVSKGQVREAAGELARRIAGRAPAPMTLHKKMFDRALESNLENTLVYETEALLTTARSSDHAEGAKAFLEKRDPEFTGY